MHGSDPGRRAVLSALLGGAVACVAPGVAAREGGDRHGENDRGGGDERREDPGDGDRGCRGRGHERGNGRNCDRDGGRGDPLRVSVTRSDDGSAFTGGQTNRIDLHVEASEPVYVRDRVPEDWSVVGGDDRRVGDGSVAFTYRVAEGTRTYLAEAPEGVAATGEYSFGPVAVSVDGERWETVDGTDRDVVVLGPST